MSQNRAQENQENETLVNGDTKKNTIQIVVDDQSILKEIQSNTCISIIVGLIFAFLFLFYSTQEKYYGGDDCKNLKLVCQLTGYFLLVSSLVKLFLFVPIASTMGEKHASAIITYHKCMQVIETIISLVLLIALIVIFFDKEECDTLHTFVKVYLILLLSLACIGCCCMTCMFCCLGFLGLGMSASAQAR